MQNTGYNTSTTTNYANVAYDGLIYNTASATLTISSNSKRLTSYIKKYQ